MKSLLFIGHRIQRILDSLENTSFDKVKKFKYKDLLTRENSVNKKATLMRVIKNW